MSKKKQPGVKEQQDMGVAHEITKDERNASRNNLALLEKQQEIQEH